MNKVILPGTKHWADDERTFEVGKWYKTFTTDMRNEKEWLFKIDSIDENSRIYYTTISGIQRSASGTKRTQFTKNAQDISEGNLKQNLIINYFRMDPRYWPK